MIPHVGNIIPIKEIKNVRRVNSFTEFDSIRDQKKDFDRMDLMSYVKVYDNFFSEEYCDELMKIFDHTWDTEQEKIQKNSMCATCVLCNCDRIEIGLFDGFKPHMQNIINSFETAVKMYIDNVIDLPHIQFPKDYNYEGVKIKRYEQNTVQQFKTHVDTHNRESANRFLTLIVYLNDGFSGGELHMDLFDKSIKPKKGSILIMPPWWCYVHTAKAVTGDRPKYFLGSYLLFPKQT